MGSRKENCSPAWTEDAANDSNAPPSNDPSTDSHLTSGTSMATSRRSQLSSEHNATRHSPRYRLRETVRYLIFVILLSITVYSRNYDYVKNQWIDSISRRFTPSFDWINTNGEVVPAFTSLTSVAQFWRFLDHFAGVSLRPDNGTTSYDGSYLLGSVLLQQKRVKAGLCPQTYKEVYAEGPAQCPLPLSSDNLAQDPFGPDGIFTWTGGYQKDANWWLPTAHPKFGVGGYNFFLALDTKSNHDLVHSLMANKWVDAYTVAILLDFSLYNLNGNRICAIRLLFELPEYGGVKTTADVHVIDAFPYDRLSKLPIALFEFLFVLYFLYMLVKMFENARLNSRATLYSLWNIIDLVSFCLVAVVIGSRIVHDLVALKLASACASDQYVDWQNLAVLELYIRDMISVVIIIAWLRIAKYLFHMTNGLRMIKRVLIGTSVNLAMFLVFLTIVLMGYVHAFFLAFHVDIPQFDSMGNSFLTAFGSIFGPGKFSFEEVQHSNFLLGPLLAFGFFASMELLLAHMFFAIVHGSYHDHRLAEKDVNFAKMVMAEVNSTKGTSSPRPHPRKTIFTKFSSALDQIFSTNTYKVRPEN